MLEFAEIRSLSTRIQTILFDFYLIYQIADCPFVARPAALRTTFLRRYYKYTEYNLI